MFRIAIAVMMAELVHHYFPKLVEMHNYSNANSVRQKLYNWATLNQKVFRRLGFTVDKAEVDAVVSCKPSAIETVLLRLERHIADIRSKRPHMTFSPGGDGASPAAADGAAARGFGSGATASALHANDPYGAAASQQQFASAVSAAASSASRVGGSGASVAAPSAAHPAAAYAGHSGGSGSGSELVAEKDATIAELRETIEILELKIKKLEQVRAGCCCCCCSLCLSRSSTRPHPLRHHHYRCS